MAESFTERTDLGVPVGTQIVLRGGDLPFSLATGMVAEIVRPAEGDALGYRIRLIDGREANLRREQFSILKHMKAGSQRTYSFADLRQYVVYECVVGSRAYGLYREDSDTDRRGIYLPPADLQWSLDGVPKQIENNATQETYWELRKFLLLALRANPNVLECLFTPLIEQRSEIADALLAGRPFFLSKLVYQTYNGYVLSQFKKLEQDLRTAGAVKWKHAMHLIRLLLQGIHVLAEAHVPVEISEHRDALLAIRNGVVPWTEVNSWRLALHREFDRAVEHTSLPDAPDYAAVNRLLVWARRTRVEARHDS